jgi:hypothetical protein
MNTNILSSKNNIDINTIVDENDEQILICAERLQKLELLEKQLPEMIEAAIQEHKRNKLKMLHEKDKENPGAVNLRVKRYNERHKEEINARRRAKRKIQKDAEEAAKPHISSVVESFNTTKAKMLTSKIVILTNTDKKAGIIGGNSENNVLTIGETCINTPPYSPTLNEVLTVRFDI